MRQGASDAAELAAAVGRDRARSHLARGGGGADRAAWGRARTVQEVGIRVLYREAEDDREHKEQHSGKSTSYGPQPTPKFLERAVLRDSTSSHNQVCSEPVRCR